MYYLGIDLGGTNISCGVVNEKFEIVGRGKVKTNAGRPVEEIVDDMVNAALMAVKNAGLTLKNIESIGVGSPGSVNTKTGIVAFSNNIGFKNFPLKKVIENKLNITTYIENDANAAAYGEMLAGAGKECNNLVTITLGTGVGGGIIINKKIYSGFNGAGAELGHMVIVKDGIQCSCGRKGCWEAYASATALIRQTKEAMLENKNTVMWELTEGDINKVNGITAFNAMRQSDPTGIEVVNNYINYISCGLVNIINIFQPEILCIGGGISKEGNFLIDPIKETVIKESYSRNLVEQTIIKTAELGNDAGIIGAAFLEKLYK